MCRNKQTACESNVRHVFYTFISPQFAATMPADGYLMHRSVWMDYWVFVCAGWNEAAGASVGALFSGTIDIVHLCVCVLATQCVCLHILFSLASGEWVHF